MPIAVIAILLLTLFVTAETGWAETVRAGREGAGLSERTPRAEARSRAQTMAICEGCGVSPLKKKGRTREDCLGYPRSEQSSVNDAVESAPSVAVHEPCGGTS